MHIPFLSTHCSPCYYIKTALAFYFWLTVHSPAFEETFTLLLSFAVAFTLTFSVLMALESYGFCCSRPKYIAWSNMCKVFLKSYPSFSNIEEACLCPGGNHKDDQICSRCVGLSLTRFEAVPQTDLPAGWLAHKSQLTHLHVRHAQLWVLPSGLYPLCIRFGWHQMGCGNSTAVAIASFRIQLLGLG